MKYLNIAIDGPAGAGKSTVAKELAARLGHVYVDTGAMYRAMAIYFLRKCLSPEDEKYICAACQEADVTIYHRNGQQLVYLNGEDVTPYLRDEEVGRMASATSVYGPVRERLVTLQRLLAENTCVVMDGRDIGTVVLPEAALKIFLTASVEERARRRAAELQEKGLPCDPAQIAKDIEERDYRDSHRPIGPLKQAEDAVLIDSSSMTAEQVVDRIEELYRETEARHAGA